MEFLVELLLQLVIEVLVELGFHGMGHAGKPDAGPPAWIAAISYLVFGFLVGLLTLGFFPTLFVRAEWLQIANLVVTPLLVAGLMSLLGSWRRKRGQPLVRLDRFAYAYAFALMVSVVRFTWGR